jgi:hypothetical protein
LKFAVNGLTFFSPIAGVAPILVSEPLLAWHLSLLPSGMSVDVRRSLTDRPPPKAKSELPNKNVCNLSFRWAHNLIRGLLVLSGDDLFHAEPQATAAVAGAVAFGSAFNEKATQGLIVVPNTCRKARIQAG